MFKCQKCQKNYKQEKSLLKHQIKCQNKSKNIRPSLDQMWYMILKQQKQINEQKKEIDKLKKIINKDVKSINILEWLNENIDMNINYSTWIKRHVIITPQHMKQIMKISFIESIYNILKQLCEIDKKLVPIYCFNDVKKTIYIYENKWIKSNKEHITMIFDEINLQLLKHNIEYEKTLDEVTLYSKKHLENNQKLFVTDTIKKDAIKNKIKSELINIFKIDLNELNKYKFYI